MEEIEEQIKLDPITKDKAREQFVQKTNELGLKHRFDFDTTWEAMVDIENKRLFREKIMKLQEEVESNEGSLKNEALHSYNPVKHDFADGCYIREIFNPAGQLLITKIHKKRHPFFLMKGKMSILTENGISTIEAPYNGITEPGTKRAIYTHTDCVFITVHATELTDVDEIVNEVTATDFSDEDIALIDFTQLKIEEI